jgi:hypothetical protein
VVLEPHEQLTLDTCPLPEQCVEETGLWWVVTNQVHRSVVESSS